MTPMWASGASSCRADRSRESVSPAALDNESEHLVAESLDKLAAGRTTLTIAHRLTTIQGADRILVLSGSRIVEEGNHDTLMKQRGIYYQLYTSANMADQEAAE